MKIICTKSNLVKGVSIVSKAVPSKTTMPILECILIDATTDTIKLTANDMELGIETTIEGTILQKGIIALDAKIFSEIVRKLPEFTLKEVIRQTIFSISDMDSNKLMSGELFEVDQNILKVVSLDGHRISIRKIELKESYEPRKVVVPGKTLQEISKILSGETESEVTKVRINKKELLSCIDRATLLVKEGDKKPIIINITDESMQLKIQSQIGSMNEEIMITKDGKDLLIGFNPKFLIDALRVIDDEEVSLYFMNAKAPCFIKDEEQSYIYLILPVNFNAAA